MKEETPTTAVNLIHVGDLIRLELQRQERSVSWLARKLCCDRSNVYKIFQKQSVDVALLSRLCSILNHNFFEDLAAMTMTGRQTP